MTTSAEHEPPKIGPGRRVLVAGGAGFIGHHLVQGLSDAGYRVVVFDDLSTGRRESVASIEHVELVVGDILDRPALERAFEGVELLINLASIVGMRRVHVDPVRALRVSNEGTQNLLDASGNCPALLVSSSAVYGIVSREQAEETAEIQWPEALDYDGGSPGYACGKQLLEQRGYAAMGRGRAVMILRPFNIVGPGQVGTYGMVVPSFLQRTLVGQPLEIHDDGEQTRSFGDVHTFVRCVLRLIETPPAWRVKNNPINIGTRVSTSIRCLAQVVFEQTGRAVPIEHVPFDSIFPGKRDVRARRPSIQRLESLVGPVEWRTIDNVVSELVELVETS